MHYLEQGELETVLDSVSVEVPGLSLYYPSRSTALPKLRAFVEFATKHMRRDFQPGDYLPTPGRLKGVISCGFIGLATYRVKTVLPCVLPSHIARKASSARSMGRTFPISGAMPAPAMKDIMFFMS
jgi:hypothetical protein